MTKLMSIALVSAFLVSYFQVDTDRRLGLVNRIFIDDTELMAVSPNGDVIATYDVDTQILQFLNVSDGTTFANIELPVLSVEFINAPCLVSIIYYGNAREADYHVAVYDAATNQMYATGNGVKLSEDQTLFAVIQSSNPAEMETSVYESCTGHQILTVEGRGIEFSPDNRLIAIAQLGNSEAPTLILNVASGSSIATTPYEYIHFSPDARYLLALEPILGSDGGAYVHLINLGTSQVEQTFTKNWGEFSPDGSMLLVVGNNGSQLIQITTQEILFESEEFAKMSPDWTYLVEYIPTAAVGRAINWQTGQISEWFWAGWSTFHPTRPFLVTCHTTPDDVLVTSLADLETGIDYATYPNAAFSKFSPDGQFMILISENNGIHELREIDTDSVVLTGQQILFSDTNEFVFRLLNEHVEVYEVR